MSPLRLEELLEAHFDGRLDGPGLAELESALAGSAEARGRYWAFAAQHALLREILTEARGLAAARAAPAGGAHPAARAGRRLFWTAAAAAVAAVAAAALLVAAPGGRLPSALANPGSAPLVRTLPDGTTLVLAPGARLELLGPDPARRVRGRIRLEAGWVEVRTPRSPSGETACRLETPDGLWLETRGTVFRAERAFEDERGARVPAASPSGAALAGLLLVSVADGAVAAGRDEVAEKRVEAGGSAELKALTEYFRRRRAHWMKIAQEDEARRNPAEMLELARDWAELGEHAEAREACRRLLGRFDPDGDGTGVPDAKLPEFARLQSALVSSPEFPTVEMLATGRRRLERIRQAFYGPGGQAARDYPEAARQIATFLGEFPGFGRAEPDAEVSSRAALEDLRREAELRAVLLWSAGDLAWSCLELGLRAAAEGRGDEARELFTEGAARAEQAAAGFPRDAELAFRAAACRQGLGGRENLERAVAAYAQLRRSREEDDLWWRSTRGLVESLAALDRRDDARAVLKPILLTTDRARLERLWPGASATATRLGLAEGAAPAP
ncbi:MAG TPA: hypothetical protein PK280_13930 [Planctomycetota bacterium]|nr:hypothetical protein [Planctomycetota bacterium]